MPKTPGFSRDNVNNSMGFLDQIVEWTNAGVNTYDDVLFNSLTTTQDLIVGGSLTVNGNTSVISTEIVEIEDNIVLLNSQETGSGVTLGSAGFEVERGTLPNFQSVYQETTGLYKIGEVGSLQAVATREDTPLDKGVMVYDSVTQRIISSTNIELSTTFSAGVNPSSSSTGTIILSGGGGMGISGDIYTDGRIFIKGSTYGNYFDATVLDELVVNSATNFSFQQAASSSIKIPTDVYLTFGISTSRIYKTDTSLNIENTPGNINFTTASAGSVTLPLNTYLQWDSGNRIRYNSIDMVLDSTGNFLINPPITSSDSTVSTSSITGSLKIAGGVGISNSTDASSSTNGGTFTSAGGVAIRKTVFIGDRLRVADQALSLSQVAQQGVNFESKSRALTTTSTTDTVFNSFGANSISLTTGTITNSSTVYIEGSPTISGGGSLTNSYSLWVDDGVSRFDGVIRSTNTTVSSTPSSGAILLEGGLSINNATNSSSSTNGGTFTTVGGAAISKTLFVGEQINIGDVSTTVTQVAGQGVNFRSRTRNITTVSSSDMMVNTFEGGNIVTGATISNASTVYINGAPTVSGGSITNPYSLWVGNGTCRLDGGLLLNATTASTSPSTGALVLQGGLSIANTTDATNENNGGTFTSAGGVAIKKKLFTGGEITSNVGTGNDHYRLYNTGLARFTLGLRDSESGSNSGSNYTISRYNDAGVLLDSVLSIQRSSGDTSLTITTASTNSTSGALKLAGGLGISNSTNATSSTNGGSFTTAGGIAVAKDFYTGGNAYITTNLDVDGVTTLDQTTINTTDGQMSVSGTNGINMTVSGGVTVNSQAGILALNGATGATLDSSSAISIDAGAASNFSTSSGVLTLSGVGLSLGGGSGEIDITTTSLVDVNSGVGGITFDTTDTSDGIKIGANSASTPITIGHTSSEVVIGDNITIGGNLTVLGTTTTIESIVTSIVDNALVVNALPSGLSDGGYLIRRYQTPNDDGTGTVVTEVAKETGSFQSGSSTPDTLVLSAGANVVDDYYVGWWIKITSGAGIDQVRRIKTYVGATKTATIYLTSDNTSSFQDGLDLTITPAAADTYSLYDCGYIGMYFSETNDEVRFACLPFDVSSGVFPEPSEYISLHVGNLTIEGSYTSNGDFTNNGKVTVEYTDAEAFLVRKSGDTGDVFTIDTLSGNVIVANPVNTLASDVSILFQQLDNLNIVQTYSQINSSITGNTSGNLISTLNFQIQKGVSGLVTYLSLSGDTTGFADFSTNVDAVRILNTTASTSSSTGSLRLSGGLGITNSTNSTSSTNGGSFTTSGGAAIAQKLYVGGQIDSVSTLQVTDTSNTITGAEGSINTAGDLTLYNATKNTIIYRGVGSASPAFTNRSVGTKTVFNPTISGSTVDYAIGVEPSALWYSASQSSDSHKFYLATTEYFRVDNTGVSIRQNGDGIGFYNGVDTARVYQNTNTLRIVPHETTETEGVVFRNSADTVDRVRINSDGKLSVALSSSSAAPGTSGSFLDVKSTTFTDNTTASSNTSANMRFTTFQQSTLAASNTLVTTTDAINTFIGGAPIKGTNQAITNAYTLYIDEGFAISSSGVISSASSLYIKGAPTGTTITNAYALFIDSGNSRFDGRISITETEQATTTDTGALRVSGGASIEKSLVVGTVSGSVLGLNFDQRYDFSGNVSGELNIQSKSTGVGAKTRYFTNDGDNTDSNLLEIYGLGTAASTATSEFIRMGYEPTGYSIKTQASGTGSVRQLTLETGSNTGQVVLLTTGEVSLSSTVASTSSSTGALQLSGGLAISNSTNSTSSTNGGSFTTSGGAAIAQDLFIGGDVTITGSFEGGVTTPSLTTSNSVNITGGVTISLVKLITNGSERMLSVIFRLTPTVSDLVTSFQVTTPGITSFTNVWDVVAFVGGFRNDADPVNLENTLGFAVTSSNRVKISFTAGGTDTHTIQFAARYTV